jgi:hypothetical protein
MVVKRITRKRLNKQNRKTQRGGGHQASTGQMTQLAQYIGHKLGIQPATKARNTRLGYGSNIAYRRKEIKSAQQAISNIKSRPVNVRQYSMGKLAEARKNLGSLQSQQYIAKARAREAKRLTKVSTA